MILRVRLFLLSAAIVVLLAGASFARGAPAAESQVYISGIQVNPKRPNIVYASTIGPDSMLKSTDAGKTWSVADTGLTNPASPTDSQELRVDALVLDPRSPNILYAGTGIGVFKTTNGARTWKLASTGIKFGRDGLAHRMYEGFIWGLAIDPVHTSRVYAGSFEGVWKTNNGGATWKRVLQNGVLSLGIDPRRPEIVYANAGGGFQLQATRDTIFKSVDGGGSWRATGPSGLHDSYFGHPIVVDRRAPGTIYTGGSRGLFASASEGRTWKKVLPLRRANSGVNAIALDPSRANVLYVGTSTQGVMKSVNGGQIWSALRLGRGISAMAIGRTRPQTIYAGAYWPTRPEGQVAGMFASTDGGATWHRLF